MPTATKRYATSLPSTIAAFVYNLPGGEPAGIDLHGKPASIARQTAECLIERTQIMDDVVAYLVGLLQNLNDEKSIDVAGIIDHLVPLNYSPQPIEVLHGQLNHGGLGLVDVSNIATSTIAEIIMAGFDKKPATFRLVGMDRDSFPGRTALEVFDGPEVGFDDSDPDLVIQRRVRNFLIDLVERKNVALGGRSQPQRRPTKEASKSLDLLDRKKLQR
jgi:hypothetical protein